MRQLLRRKEVRFKANVSRRKDDYQYPKKPRRPHAAENVIEEQDDRDALGELQDRIEHHRLRAIPDLRFVLAQFQAMLVGSFVYVVSSALSNPNLDAG